MNIYTKFSDDDIVRGNPTDVTTGIFSGDTGSLSTFYTSPIQTGSVTGQYYWNVYNVNPTSSNAEIQFAVTYGHRLGGGQASLANNPSSTLSTKAVYSQYRNLLLDPGDSQFTFAGNYNSDQIYVINFQRTRLKKELDPGNWQMTLSGSNGSFTFIDDSGQTLGSTYGHAGSVFNVVSGSLFSNTTSGSTVTSVTSSTQGGFGLVYPSLGLIVLNPAAIAQTVGFVSGSITSTPTAPFLPTVTQDASYVNHAGLFNSIALGKSFLARSAETISSTHYFVRLRNKEYNYSNNPTFYDQVTGTLSESDFVNDPRPYVTTIGFYNDNNELLAVAKLSKPIQKSFASEMVIAARLDF